MHFLFPLDPSVFQLRSKGRDIAIPGIACLEPLIFMFPSHAAIFMAYKASIGRNVISHLTNLQKQLGHSASPFHDSKVYSPMVKGSGPSGVIPRVEHICSEQTTINIQSISSGLDNILWSLFQYLGVLKVSDQDKPCAGFRFAPSLDCQFPYNWAYRYRITNCLSASNELAYLETSRYHQREHTPAWSSLWIISIVWAFDQTKTS